MHVRVVVSIASSEAFTSRSRYTALQGISLLNSTSIDQLHKTNANCRATKYSEDRFVHANMNYGEKQSSGWEAPLALKTTLPLAPVSTPAIHAAVYNPNLSVETIEAMVAADPLLLGKDAYAYCSSRTSCDTNYSNKYLSAITMPLIIT